MYLVQCLLLLAVHLYSAASAGCTALPAGTSQSTLCWQQVLLPNVAGLLAQPCCGLVSATLQTGPPRPSFGAARRWDTHKGEALLFEAQLVRVSQQQQQQQQQQRAPPGTADTMCYETAAPGSAGYCQRAMLLIRGTSCMPTVFCALAEHRCNEI
jgi:hypothetical protein